MTTMVQAISRARETGFPADGPVSGHDLQRHFQAPADRGSIRSLLASMNRSAATVRPFAVILCRFKDEPPDPNEATWLQFFVDVFTPGTQGLVDYWRDVSLGSIDVAGTKVFGWIEVGIRRDDAGPPTTRSDLTAAGITAVQAAGGDPITGFFTQMTIYLQSTTSTGVHIDGSTDPAGRISLGPPLNGNVIAHEMGHSFGMNHDADSTGNTSYHDPCCIMSQNGPFVSPKWNLAFGPAVCLPHLTLQGWSYSRRMFVDSGGWIQKPRGVAFFLAPNSNPVARAYLGASLQDPSIDDAHGYLLEYVDATNWNQGVLGMPYVMIRRISSHTDLGSTPDAMYLNAIQLTGSADPVVFVEPVGNVEFTVTPTNQIGPVVEVVARKLTP